MRWLYNLDLGNSLDGIGIGSVYQCDTLTNNTRLTRILRLKRIIFFLETEKYDKSEFVQGLWSSMSHYSKGKSH